MENQDKKPEEVITRDSEETYKSTGNKKKSMIIAALGAVAGAFLGDTFIGREHILVNNELLYDDGMTSITGTDILYGRDTGGIIEDMMGKTQINDVYDHTGIIVDSSDGQIGIYAFSEKVDENLIETWKELGLLNGIVQDSATPDGALIGGAIGGGVGYGADYIKRRREAKPKSGEKKTGKKGDKYY